MALFGKKKEEKSNKVDKSIGEKGSEKDKDSKNTEKKNSEFKISSKNFSDVLRKPRITEKSAAVSEGNVYVFDVNPKSNKKDIKNAMTAIYNVTPEKVNITKIQRKPVKSRRIRKMHYTKGGKKAYIYLKKGDTIQLV